MPQSLPPQHPPTCGGQRNPEADWVLGLHWPGSKSIPGPEFPTQTWESEAQRVLCSPPKPCSGRERAGDTPHTLVSEPEVRVLCKFPGLMLLFRDSMLPGAFSQHPSRCRGEGCEGSALSRESGPAGARDSACKAGDGRCSLLPPSCGHVPRCVPTDLGAGCWENPGAPRMAPGSRMHFEVT